MASIILLPDAAGTYQQWSNYAGTVPTNVQTSDGDTSGRTSGTASQIDTFSCDDLPAEAVNITLYRTQVVSKGFVSNVAYKHYLRTGGTNLAQTGTETASTSGYGAVYYTWDTAPGSLAWTPALVNDTQIGYQYADVDDARYIRVTCVRAFVDYVAGGGGYFSFGLGFSWIPPLIAVASHCILKSEIAQILSKLKIRPSTDEEFDAILNEFNRRPRFCFVGM